MHQPWVRRSVRRGITLPMVVLCLVGLIGVVAIAIDGGFLLDNRRQVQMAADASALAAAVDLFTYYPKNKGTDPYGTAKTSALTTAKANGFTDGGNSTVTVNIPPQSGAFSGQAGYVEVIIQYQQGRYFSAIWGKGKLTVSARTVARGLWNPPKIGVLLLDPTDEKTLEVDGALVVQNGGSVIVNSNDPEAVEIKDDGASVTAGETDITGGVDSKSKGYIQGTLKTGAAPTPDPLATLPVPASPLPIFSSKDYSGLPVLTPGTYAGGIKLDGSGSVTMMPGIYYVQGDFEVGGNVNLTGSGVMIYNAPGDGSIELDTKGSINLSPPTSGVYQGVTIFQDRSNNKGIEIGKDGNINITGTLYAPAADFELSGDDGQSYNVGSQIIGYSMEVEKGTFNVDPASAGLRKRQIQIVE